MAMTVWPLPDWPSLRSYDPGKLSLALVAYDVTSAGLAEQRLALAVDAARLGSWTWDLRTGVTTWDERLEEMHGLAPGGFGGTYEDWVAALYPDDRAACIARVEHALASPGPYTLIHRTTWSDGSIHTIECRGTVLLDDRGEAVGTTGVAIDVTSRERMVQTLQQTLLPAELPTVPGVVVACRFRAAESRIEIGGDWYAAVPLPGPRLGLGIGDVAGHGLEAVNHMASARFSLRTIAMDAHPPEGVLSRLSRVVETFERGTLITALYGILDPGERAWAYATAGHVPAVLRSADGNVRLLDEQADPPLGVGEGFRKRTVRMSPGDSLVLYTDGLIERRGEDIRAGFDRLLQAARQAPSAPQDMCGYIIDEMLSEAGTEDDAALVCVTMASAGHA